MLCFISEIRLSEDLPDHFFLFVCGTMQNLQLLTQPREVNNGRYFFEVDIKFGKNLMECTEQRVEEEIDYIN
jgi:hypothetical protein